jgi:hypothetical protein
MSPQSTFLFPEFKIVQNPDFVVAINNANHRMEICLFVSNVDEIYKQIKLNGVQTLSEL